MLKKELVERSPLRALDQSVRGGLLAGCMGVFMSEKGVGKTACLVHVATDHMLQGKNIIHISFSDTTHHIAQWYDDIYRELASEYRLEAAQEIHNELGRQRVILKFEDKASSLDHLERNIALLRESARFEPGVIIVDGYNFAGGSMEQISALRSFAQKMNAAVWCSASLPPGGNHVDSRGIPELMARFAGMFEIMIRLEQGEGHVRLKLVKDYDIIPLPEISLELDTHTLLIKKKG